MYLPTTGSVCSLFKRNNDLPRRPSLPFVSFDVVSLHVLEVVSEVILQSGHHAAVFVHQLSGSGLRREPVHHRRLLLVLHLLTQRVAQTALQHEAYAMSASAMDGSVSSRKFFPPPLTCSCVTHHLFSEDLQVPGSPL